MSDIALKSAGGKTVIASLASVLIAQGYAKSKGSKGVRPLPERCGVSSRERVGPRLARMWRLRTEASISHIEKGCYFVCRAHRRQTK